VNEVTQVRRAPPPPKPTQSSGIWLPTLAQVGDLLNSAYSTFNGWTQNYNDLSAKAQGALPDLLYAGVNNIAWYMSWAAKPVKVDKVEPVISQQAQKRNIRYGPFTLLGNKYNRTVSPITMDVKADVIMRTLKGLPNNAAILSGRLDTIFEDGSRADVKKGIYIHHLLVADVGKTSAPFALCPGGHNQKSFVPWISSHIVEAIGAGLIQAGNDQVASPTIYASPKGPLKSAFLTGYDDTFLLEAEIVNYNPENTTIYLQMEAEYLPEIPSDYLDASALVFSATGCSSPGYKPPGNNPKYNFTSESFLMDRDGYILNMRGHLHDGGSSIQMLLNGNIACESFPKYEDIPGAKKSDGSSWQTITEMSYCDDPVQFRKGDKVTLISIYDTTIHPLREGSSGEGGHVDAGHGGGGHEGMDMAEEMGIFIVNIASTQPGKAAPVAGPKNPAAPIPLNPKPENPAAPNVPAANAPPKPSGAPMAGMPGMPSGHSHGGRSMKVRRRNGMLIDLPEAAEWIYV